MARGKKWTVPFESLGGVACRVDIYEEGYSGSVTNLSTANANAPGVPAAVPFVIEEDDSNDLTHFIRFKTGSLRLVELTYGGLQGLRPRSLRDHYIEAYYGSECVFTGFMQCQEFDDDWVAAPRELEFPIISPLGLLESFTFTPPQTPGLVTLGELMHEVITGLGGGYTGVIYPVASSYEPWTDVISSTVMCPFNSAFKHYDSASKLYDPKDYKYFIEGICACFGWMVHDTATDIEFTKFDYTNQNYSRLTIAGLLNPASGWSGVQQRADSFSSYYTNTDNNAMQSMVLPLKEINLNLEGADIKDKSLGTDHTQSGMLGMVGGTNQDNKPWRGAALTQIGPDVDGDHIGTPTFSTNGEVYYAGLFPLGYGTADVDAVTIGMQENWLLKYSTGWSSGSLLLKAVFYGMLPISSSGDCLLKLKIERGISLFEMASQDYTTFTMNLVIKVGSMYYYLDNDIMTTTPTLNSITIDGNTGKVVPNKSLALNSAYNDVDGIIFRPRNTAWNVNDTIEVMLYDNGQMGLADGEYLRFTELSLKNPSGLDDPYNSYYESRETINIGGSSTGVESRDVTVNFNNYVFNRGEHSFGDSDGDITGSNPTFPYMFVPLTVLTEKVKRTATPGFDEYAALWTYWISGWRWRMIAHNFNLVDDEHQITLARSTTIE